MLSESLLGRVIVVAGEQAALANVATAAAGAGAAVAVISTALPDLAVTVRFRADPRDAAVWERVAMHIEQHLGPVDGAAADDSSYDVVRAVLQPDLSRRGHGAIVCVAAGADPEEALRSMVGTPRATAEPPDRVEQDR